MSTNQVSVDTNRYKFNTCIPNSEPSICPFQTIFTIPVKKYLVIKFIGSLSHQPTTCVPSKWLSSNLDRNIFIRYPPSYELSMITQLTTNNFPALGHWRSYMATFYYQTGKSISNWRVTLFSRFSHWFWYYLHRWPRNCDVLCVIPRISAWSSTSTSTSQNELLLGVTPMRT